jgi:broad specificity phosphatase PhoE
MVNQTNNLTLFLLRHGESVANVTHTFASKKLDLPLTDFGTQQINQIAEPMKNIGFDIIYTSPLLRAQQTAEIIGKSCGLNPIVVESLREIDVGELDGKCIEETDRRKIYDGVISKWDKGQNDIGFKEGESLIVVGQRIKDFLKALDDKNDEKILVVAHGLLFMAFIWLFSDNHGPNFESGRINRCHYSALKKGREYFHIIAHDIAPENSKKGLY